MKTCMVLRLSFWVSFAFVLNAIATLVAAFATVAHLQLLEMAVLGDGISPRLAQMSDTRQRFVAGFQLSMEGVSGLLFFLWVYHANRNARALGAEGMKYTPIWSVLWFFIPVANLFVPYLVMSEIWKASSPNTAGEWRKTFVSPVLAIWWCITVLSSLVRYDPTAVLLGRMNLTGDVHYYHPESLDPRLEYFQGLLIWYILSLALSILSCVVILIISGRQEHKWMTIAELSGGQGGTSYGGTVER